MSFDTVSDDTHLRMVFVTDEHRTGTMVTGADLRAKFRSGPVRARQIDLEDTAKVGAVNRFRDMLETHANATRAADTGLGNSVTRAHLQAVLKAITWAVESGRALGSYGEPLQPQGRPPAYMELLRQLSPDHAALYTLRAVVNAALAPAGNVATTARALGAALEREAMVQKFRAMEPLFVASCAETFRSRNAGDEVAAEQLLIQMRHKFGATWTPWDKKQRRALALNLVACVIAHSDLFDKEFVNQFHMGKVRGEARLTLSAVGREWWEFAGKALELYVLDPLPMVCTPIPWTGAFGGGYASPNAPPQPLVKTHDQDYLRALDPAGLVDVLDAVNAIQETPWKINERVRNVAEILFDAGGNVSGLPPRFFNEVLPPRLEEGAPKEAITARNRQARDLYARRARIESRAWRVTKTLKVARAYTAEEAIFFPCQLDFRGRVYSMVPVLTPQGTDLEKGLLHFAEGKAIDSEEALAWLAIHGANCFGKDKLPLQERIDWIEANAENVVAAAGDPVGLADWWGAADKPFQFLAFCFEWAEFRAAGISGFISHLPVSVDGTCNGLQHLSAMTRDEKGGAFVNLTGGGDKPADVYQRVADEVVVRLHERALLGCEIAPKWLAFGIDRKITKRTVMVVPYGGTSKACRDYVRAAVLEKADAGTPLPFARGRELLDASTLLSNIVWESLTETLGGARRTMKWLQSCAHLLAKEGKPIRWTTPSGFPVLQAYRETKDIILEYGPSRKPFRARMRKELDKINTAEQRNGVSPNFTHSMDAAHLVSSVNTAGQYGVNAFSMVHDSYGTHAADMPVMLQSLRAAFSSIYAGDPLAALEHELRAQFTDPATCPPRPAYGTWDPSSVLESDFFFH